MTLPKDKSKEAEYRNRLSELGKKKIGNKNPAWKDGRYKDHSYIWERCPHHPFTKNGRVLQHRLIMEKYIKRFLLPDEVVHHINGNRKDNRIENLQLLQDLGMHNKIHKTKKKREVFS